MPETTQRPLEVTAWPEACLEAAAALAAMLAHDVDSNSLQQRSFIPLYVFDRYIQPQPDARYNIELAAHAGH